MLSGPYGHAMRPRAAQLPRPYPHHQPSTRVRPALSATQHQRSFYKESKRKFSIPEDTRPQQGIHWRPRQTGRCLQHHSAQVSSQSLEGKPLTNTPKNINQNNLKVLVGNALSHQEFHSLKVVGLGRRQKPQIHRLFAGDFNL
jgi:hypothetical protein